MRNQDKNDVTSILFHRRNGKGLREVFFKTPQNRERARTRAIKIMAACPSVRRVQCFCNHSNSFI